MEKKKIIGFYDYTVILTYMGFVFAFIGIMNAIGHNYGKCILCLMAAGICDMFDGTVASTKQRNEYEKHFGIQIDSLCDLISFGVLPAIFVYEICEENKFVGLVACAFTLCGLIRLAYFNVQEYERQKITFEKREVYLGLPITSSAILIPIIYLIYDRCNVIKSYLFVVALFFLAVGYISGIEIRKPNFVGKVVMIIVGIVEVIGLLVVSGIDLI